jgi:4-hydroxy-2-oxoheptanedioate aldolase
VRVDIRYATQSGQRVSATPSYPVNPPALNQPNGVVQLTPASRPPLNRLRQQWQEKRPTFGAIATIPSIQTVQIMARSGLDWIIIDLEHGPIDLSSAHGMITATSGTPCVPLARIAANEPWLAKAPMDIGALGINFPMICSRADAEKAVRSVRYPPRGDRLWGPFHAPFRWGVSMPDYMATADDDMICMITIEHVEAVERIDEIMAVPGIDVAVIGPGDLATSINKRGRIDDGEVQALMARAEAGILKSGVPIGGVARTAEQANQMIDRGYLALALGFDWSLFQRGIAASFDGIKR